MPSSGWLKLLTSVTLMTYISSRKENGYTLIQKDVFNKSAVQCSSKIEDISTLTKLINLICTHDVIGIYRRNERAAQLCFPTVVGSSRAPLASLLGGRTYMLVERKLRKCKPGFSQSGHYCFYYDAANGNSAEKISSCFNLGGNLVKVNSAEKASAMSSFLNGLNSIGEKLHIDLKDVIGDNKLSSYKWVVDNSTMVYSDFNSGEPGYSSQECVIVHSGASFKWHDASCGDLYPTVCEADFVYEWY